MADQARGKVGDEKGLVRWIAENLFAALTL
jgi:hypothetical protein